MLKEIEDYDVGILTPEDIAQLNYIVEHKRCEGIVCSKCIFDKFENDCNSKCYEWANYLLEKLNNSKIVEVINRIHTTAINGRIALKLEYGKTDSFITIYRNTYKIMRLAIGNDFLTAKEANEILCNYGFKLIEHNKIKLTLREIAEKYNVDEVEIID